MVDRFLQPVFSTGWSSKDVYILGKHYKSIVSDQKNLKGTRFHYYSNDAGCASYILFPIYIVLRWLAEIGLFGKVELINLEPINKNVLQDPI